MSPTVKKWLRLYGISSYSSARKEVQLFKKIPYKYNFEQLCKSIAFNKNYPLCIGFHFIRGTKHKFDFNNANHIITDLMTAYDIIPDDNMDYVVPFPLKIEGRWYSIDKNNPGVIIAILK